MKARVPASAAMMPPETGASAHRNPAFSAAWATKRALSTSMVEQSIASAPGLALGTMWADHTARTCEPAGSMVITTSAAATASAAVADRRHPAATARSSAVAERSKASTSCPALARLAAIPAPMFPRPIKAILVMKLGRLTELVDELVGVAADGFIEHQSGARVGRVAQKIALAREHKAGGGHFLLHLRRVDAVSGVGVG